MAILDTFNLNGRVALVTGAARGMGQAIALGLAEAGADVAVLDVLPLDETRAGIEGLGRRCLGLERNLLGVQPDGAAEIVEAVVQGLGRLDILVNNAGILRRAPAVEFAAEDWEASLSINLSAAFYLSQAAAARFIESGRGGKIVNLASML